METLRQYQDLRQEHRCIDVHATVREGEGRFTPMSRCTSKVL
jgi:hypothetical protein